MTNRVCVQIDNQVGGNCCLDIEEMQRLPTAIIGYVDAILYTPIDIDMLLVVPTVSDDSDKDIEGLPIAEADEETEEQLEYIKVIEKGFVNISITNTNKSITYDEKKLSFRDGVIKTAMTDQLPTGDYLLIIDYAGNYEYEPTKLIYQFNVGKRGVECQFHNNVDGGYPGDNIEVPITLFDVLNGKTINNCIVNYSFNNVDYITRTNGSGYANLNFLMPEVDGNHCAMNIITNDEEIIEEYLDNDDVDLYWTIDGTLEPYEDLTQFTYDDPIADIDEDGIEDDGTEDTEEEPVLSIIEDDIEEEDDDVEENDTKYNVYVYELRINIDNNNYEMSEQVVYFAVKKINTQITAYFTKDDFEEKIIVEGDVLGNYNDKIENVKYGSVALEIPDVGYQKHATVSQYGHFSFEVQYSEINTVVSGEVPEYEAILYSPDHMTKVTICDINGEEVTEKIEIVRSYQPKKSLDLLAIVKDQITREYVSESMVTFVIKQEEKEIYRHVAEVNESGQAYMSFDVSALGEFTVQAFYHPMFNLLGSESQIINYEVKEE